MIIRESLHPHFSEVCDVNGGREMDTDALLGPVLVLLGDGDADITTEKEEPSKNYLCLLRASNELFWWVGGIQLGEAIKES